MEIFGITVATSSCSVVEQNIDQMLRAPGLHYMVTLNPEIMLRARCDTAYRAIVQGANSYTIDGFGLALVVALRERKRPERYTGIDLAHHLLYTAKRKSASVYLLARSGGLSTWRETADAIEAQYSGIACCGRDTDGHHDELDDTLREIACVAPAIVLCNFGSPAQEKFLHGLQALSREDNQVQCRQGCVMVGVGGAFDFMTGHVRRAPRIVQRLGLEWVYRLWVQPHRVRRIFRAVIVFPLCVLFSKK